MHDAFVPLGQWLQPATQLTPDIEEAVVISEPQEEDDTRAAASDVRRFRAALADALDVALHDLLRDIAVDVVARELQLQPADVQAIARSARERFAAEEPLAIRVHPDDYDALTDADVAVVADARLRRGDVLLEVRSGTIDATVGARLESVLEALGDA